MRKKDIQVDIALLYLLALVKTKYLHFGYWNEGDELTLENLQMAQERFIEKMMQFIPGDVHTILDVGCGVGGNALKLKNQGFSVEGLSPDPYQEKLFKENTHHEIPFHLTTFEEFESSNHRLPAGRGHFQSARCTGGALQTKSQSAFAERIFAECIAMRLPARPA